MLSNYIATNSYKINNIPHNNNNKMQEIHINKLPSSKYFTVGDLKQLLPIHQTSAIANLRIVFNNYALSKYPKNIILLPDENISLQRQGSKVQYYTYLKAVWCEDFDRQPEHLKNSLALASSLLNYIGTIDEDSPLEEADHDNQNYTRRIDVVSIIDGQKIESRPKKYHTLKQLKTIIGYKFQKISNKIYLLLGVNIKTRESLVLACSILRQWNMNRLKIPIYQDGIDLDLLHRICEHLFCMARGFVREVSDDYNTLHAGLANLLTGFQQVSIDHELQLCQKYKESKLNSGSLPHEAVILKCQITFRKNITQDCIWLLLSQLVIEWLLQTPTNAGCSYASHIAHRDGTQSMTVVLGSHYQVSGKNRFGGLETLLDGTSAVQALLFDQVYRKEQKDTNPIKNSMIIMNKFTAEKSEKQDLVLARQITPPQMNNSSLNDSFISQFSNQSSARKANMKNIAKLQNQIYEILKFLDSKKKILTPAEIEDIIRTNVKSMEKIQPPTGANQSEYQVAEVLNSINDQLTAQQIHLLLKSNPSQSHLLLTYFLQKGKYQRAVQLGKLIAVDNLQPLYKESLRNGLIVSRHTLLPAYLKRLVQAYVDPAVSPQPLKVEEISVPQLVEIIEKKNYNSHFYSSVLTVVFPQLFPAFTPVLQKLAPILTTCIQILGQTDHHNELVMTFIGDLLYEVCYFTNEIKMNQLTNAVYTVDKYSKILTIKEKKILEMIREGGLKGFGCEVKEKVLPILQASKAYTESQQILYQITIVQKPTQLHQFYRLLSSCHYTPTINKIAKYLQYRNHFSTVLNTNSRIVCYFLCGKKSKNQFKTPAGHGNSDSSIDAQFNSIAERILRSESGIFQDMVRLNPNVKIAGIQLKTAIKNLSNSRKQKQQQKYGIINQEQAVQMYINSTTNQNYQYVQLALSSKQRYLNYHTLSEMEKSYFRDCATTAVDHKSEIMAYVGLSDKMKILQSQTK